LHFLYGCDKIILSILGGIFMEEEKDKNEKKDIEIVTGDESDLDISPVYEHITGNRPKSQDEKPKNVIIPKVNK